MRSLLPCALVALVALSAAVRTADAKAPPQPDVVKPSVRVEMRGNLSAVWSRVGPVSFHLDANGITYHLRIDSPDLWRRATQLEDRAVVVTGELVGQTVHVATLRGDGEGTVRPLTRVKVKGKVAENVDLSALGSPPARFVWEVSVRGRKYQLDFGGDPRLLEMAQALRGKTLVITGEMQEDWLERPELVPLKGAEELKSFAPRWPVFTTVTVTGMAVEPGDDEYFVETSALELEGVLEVPAAVVEEGAPDGCWALVRAEGRTYWLDLRGRADLAELARRSAGKSVRVTGAPESRPVLLPAKSVDVLVVDGVQMIPW